MDDYKNTEDNCPDPAPYPGEALDKMLEDEWRDQVLSEMGIQDIPDNPENWDFSDIVEDPTAVPFDATQQFQLPPELDPEDTEFAYSELPPEQPDAGNDYDFTELQPMDQEGYYDVAEPQLPAEQERPQKRKKKKKRTPILIRIAIYAAAVLIAGISLGLFGWECAQDVLALGKRDQSIQVVVTETDDIDSITEKLYTKGLIRHQWLFKLYCSVTHSENKPDPGVYQLNTLYDYHALVNGMISSSGTRATTTVMISEGRDCREIFELLEENKVCTVEELEAAAATAEFDYWFLEGLDAEGGNRLEGFLYPDTYEFYISDDPENVLDKMLRNFNRKIDEDLQQMITDSGYSLREIMTIASLIEGEAADNNERADISSVIHNRLAVTNNDTPDDDYLLMLQMDSTVFYACELEGKDGFDLNIDSPYNTYKYAGLPTGPINNPGMYSIRAALLPSDTDYYYFAAGKDGVSHFFESFDAFEEFITSEDYVGHNGGAE